MDETTIGDLTTERSERHFGRQTTAARRGTDPAICALAWSNCYGVEGAFGDVWPSEAGVPRSGG